MLQDISKTTPTSYLDVSQFIIKEPSPLLAPASPYQHAQVRYFKPILTPHRPRNDPIRGSSAVYVRKDESLSQFHDIQVQRMENTPEVGPIDHDPTQIALTPLASAIRPVLEESLEGFSLDPGESYPLKKRSTCRSCRRNQAPEQDELWYYDQECDLYRIIEEDQHNSDSQDDDCSCQSEEDEEGQNENGYFHSNTLMSYEVGRMRSAQTKCPKENEAEKMSLKEISQVDYTQNILLYSNRPQNQIIKSVRQIEGTKGISSDNEKKIAIKKLLEQYLIDFETYYFEEAWNQLEQEPLPAMIRILATGLEHTFSKKFGSVPFEWRRVKLLKYLEKKKRRIWRKKVSYDCRKKVADGRLRIKGKFVTREQACEQLGLECQESYSPSRIKAMLQGDQMVLGE